MSRPLRIIFKNAWYHIMQRGINSNVIFCTDYQKQIFISLLNEITEIYSVEIHAFCLMNNHYHILLKTPEANLSNAMRYLNSLYTKKFNKLESRDGPIFRGRYKSIIISGHKYLLQVSRYIHLNPVKAKITDHPENFIWSSYKAYLGHPSNNCKIFTIKILSFFRGNNKQTKYKNFLYNGLNNDDLDELYQNNKYPVVIGNDNVKKLLDRLVKQNINSCEIPNSKKICPKITMNLIVKNVTNFYQIEIADIMRKKPRTGNLPRTMIMYFARYLSKATLEEIATYFKNISYPSVSVAITRLLKKAKLSKKLRSDIKRLKQKILDSN